MAEAALKKGSRGARVRSIQNQLNKLGFQVGKADGIFGKNTEGAIKTFQARHFITGVVDSLTEAALFKTQVPAALKPLKCPPITWVASPNFSARGGAPISLVVIHFTASGTLGQACGWFENPAANASSHYVLGTDGKIVQMVKDTDKAWHAGRSHWRGMDHCNRFSIGIEVVNWGELKFKSGQFFAWPGNYTRKYSGPKPLKIKGKYWAPYTEKQYRSLIPLCQQLIDKYKISTRQIVGHVDIAPDRKVDPGPHFDWQKVRASLVSPV